MCLKAVAQSFVDKRIRGFGDADFFLSMVWHVHLKFLRMRFEDELKERLGYQALDLYDKPDAGLWEFRSTRFFFWLSFFSADLKRFF